MARGKVKTRNVFHVPALDVDLISIPKLAATSITIMLITAIQTILQKGQTIAKAQHVGN
jgi:hypothetical protein